ncbi:hypothetical protein [Enterococcus faecium]|uniref:hypothetical protein n=1 Tax=Enterococcus faecium TaxID=1352 RepID=UPI00222109E2|nr:hypothetical protein [Enterococcus faecium]
MQQATRQHSVEVDGKAYNINVDTVWVLPQPIGTLYNLLLADDGSVQDESLISQKIVLLILVVARNFLMLSKILKLTKTTVNKRIPVFLLYIIVS